MNKNVTDMNDTAKHQIQPGFPTVVKQFMIDVGRCETRVNGDRTQGRLLKASGTGDEDPRKVLRQFAGTDAGALNLSKFLTQFIPTSIFIAGDAWPSPTRMARSSCRASRATFHHPH
jgi:hypothetical protein